MKKHATYKKITAAFLSVIFFCSLLFSLSCIIMMATNNFYNHSRNRVRQKYYEDELFTHLYHIVDYYEESTENLIFYTGNDIFAKFSPVFFYFKKGNRI